MQEKTNTVVEPSRRVPVLGRWDVLVCGGGPAGCAAAISAAKNGVRTLLVEKDGYLGGAVVSQLVINIHSTNGVDFQGIWHEYARALTARRAVSPMHGSIEKAHIGATVDPEQVKYVWDELLTEADVEQLLHTHISTAVVEDGVIRGVIADTRAGRQAILADRVIDCTGDGVVCHAAGVAWEQGADGKPWAMSLSKVFRVANVDLPDGVMPEEMWVSGKAALERAVMAGKYSTPVVTTMKRFLGYLNGWSWHKMMAPSRRREFRSVLSRVLRVDPLDPWDFTRAEREGRKQAMEAAQALIECIPGFNKSYLLDTSNQIGLRSSRRIRCIAVSTNDDVQQFTKYPDGIARSSWEIDVWPSESYTDPGIPRHSEEWKERRDIMASGEYFDVRYGCLIAEDVSNLLVAGRCISAEHEAQASLRIQQTCMSTGEAAGLAAALSCRQGVTPRELDPREVVSRLAEQRDVEPAFEMLRGIRVAPGAGAFSG
jgi:hypothetical protein